MQRTSALAMTRLQEMNLSSYISLKTPSRHEMRGLRLDSKGNRTQDAGASGGAPPLVWHWLGEFRLWPVLGPQTEPSGLPVWRSPPESTEGPGECLQLLRCVQEQTAQGQGSPRAQRTAGSILSKQRAEFS